ncbi:MAG: hypothetical protein DRR00_27845, partial [Candidatus Parabeggiatoa sp. nov. 3]
AIELSLNQSRFVPGETLVLTLNEDWSGEADVYVAVTIPGGDSFFFLTPLNFGLGLAPYAQASRASGSSEILRLTLPAGLPTGEYTFSAAAMRVTGFIDEVIGNVVQASFIFATEAEPVDLTFGETRLPDGVIGRSYSFAIEPETGSPPYQFSLNSGTLPVGLTLGSESGLIQGEPTERGMAQFTVQVVDASGNVGEIEGAIKVFGILSFGEHGTFKGCNGLQMAFNSAQDLDEIRIEQGTYECNELLIPSSKSFEYGIKVSGGWDSGFENQSDDPAVTVFDGGAKMLEGLENKKPCEEAGNVWKWPALCFQEEPPSSSILTVSADGSVAIEGLSFQNGHSSNYGGAIHGNGKVGITNGVFTNNSASSDYGGGGAVYNAGNITNSIFLNNLAEEGGAVSSSSNITYSTFTNNSALDYGGAVFNSGNLTHNTFTNNSASENGGAIYGSGNITNSTFTNNSARSQGGAVSGGRSNITNSTFSNNSAENGGAVFQSGNVANCTFTKNSASENGGAIWVSDYYSTIITNSTFTKNSGGAIYKRGHERGRCTVVNSTIVNNNGGGFYGDGTILNTIFAQNKVGVNATDITPTGDLHVDYTLVNNISGGVDLGTHIIMGEPRFVDADNGNFQLLADSPAVNVGDSSVVTACSKYDNCESSCSNNCDDRNSEECKKTCCSCKQYAYPFLQDDNGNALDLDGKPRIVGEAIDLGVYELQ